MKGAKDGFKLLFTNHHWKTSHQKAGLIIVFSQVVKLGTADT